jgi:hypothetical protein
MTQFKVRAYPFLFAAISIAATVGAGFRGG